MLSGENSILNQAGKSRDITGQRDIEEEIKLAYLGAVTNGTGSFNRGKFVEELDKTFGAGKYILSTDWSTITIDEKDYDTGLSGKWSNAEKTAMTSNNVSEVTGDAITNDNLKDTTKIKAVIKDEDDAQIPIPINAEYIEGKESTGVVIKYKNSEFVWVTVPHAIYDSNKDSMLPKSYKTGNLRDGHDYTPMAINIGTEDNPIYIGLLYTYHPNGGAYLLYPDEFPYQGPSTEYREPVYLEDANCDDNTLYGKLFNSVEFQRSYNTMIESVEKFGGFFLGRYETSINDKTGKAQSIAGVKPSNSSNEVTKRWYGFYKIQKEFTDNTDKMQSEMMWGTQYNAMCNWAMKGKDREHVTANSNATHDNTYDETTILTRVTTENDNKEETDRINNIFDLEGNLREWAQEAKSTNNRIFFGGVFSWNSTPITYYGGAPSSVDKHIGSRMSLYIK